MYSSATLLQMCNYKYILKNDMYFSLEIALNYILAYHKCIRQHINHILQATEVFLYFIIKVLCNKNIIIILFM